MANRFYKNGELKDSDIIAAIRRAADDYEDGAIVEARDLLAEIIFAIDDYTFNEAMFDFISKDIIFDDE